MALTPLSRDSMTTVPDPENGSITLRDLFFFSARIKDLTHAAEKPAEYLNHLLPLPRVS